MGKLHELLAVEKDARALTDKILKEAQATFGSKADHFTSSTKRYIPVNDSDSMEAEALSEHREMVTTVDKKLEYVFDKIINSLDIAIQKDMTNQSACADIIVDGNVIANNVPATTLLNLEDRVREIRDMCNMIPTLTPGLKWISDESQGSGIYRTEYPDVKIRTKKMIVYKTVAEATDRHPAQIKEESQDIIVGKYEETRYSSMLSPAEKSKLMGRIDKLLASIKKARTRANEQEIIDASIGKKLIDFIRG